MTKTGTRNDLEIPNQLMIYVLNTLFFPTLGRGNFKELLFNFMVFKDLNVLGQLTLSSKHLIGASRSSNANIFFLYGCGRRQALHLTLKYCP